MAASSMQGRVDMRLRADAARSAFCHLMIVGCALKFLMAQAKASSGMPLQKTASPVRPGTRHRVLAEERRAGSTQGLDMASQQMPCFLWPL